MIRHGDKNYYDAKAVNVGSGIYPKINIKQKYPTTKPY